MVFDICIRAFVQRNRSPVAQYRKEQVATIETSRNFIDYVP